MTALLVLCALLLIAMAGTGVTLLVIPKRETHIVEFVSLAILFGAAIIALLLFVNGFLFRGRLLNAVTTICCIAIFLAGIVRARRQRMEIAWPKFHHSWSFLLALIVAIQIVLVAWQAMVQPLRWDGLFAWEIKARLAFLNGGHMPLDYYSDPTRQWSHPQYPLLIPLTESWLYAWSGDCNQGIAKVIFPFAYIAAAGFLFASARRFISESWRGCAVAALMFFVPSMTIGPGSASSGWSDFPLAVVYLGAVIYLLDYAMRGARTSLTLFGLCGAILPWVKQEGLILWGCLFIIACVPAWRRREITSLLLASIPAAIVIVGWKIFLIAAKAYPPGDFVPFKLATIFANIGRIDAIALYVSRQIVDFERWSLLWIGGLIALCILSRSRRQEAVILALAILMPATLYSGIYLLSAWPDFRIHIATSFPRLLLDVSLVALLAIAFVLPSIRSGNDVIEKS